MKNIEALVRGRKSFRTYDGRGICTEDMEKLRAFMARVENPYGIDVGFTLLDGKVQSLPCPVVVGTDVFVGARVKKGDFINEAVGYSFEKLILFAQSLGIGTVWIGGTMDRGAFERAMNLADGEIMPCVSPLGYPAKKTSLRESLMRKGIRADDRADFGSMFFDGNFGAPLTYEKAGRLAFPLEMVRLGPSAVNRQPWRVVVTESAAHFYLKRAKGFGGGAIDMQKIDMGIALCHFDLAAEETGIKLTFAVEDPGIVSKDGEEYIASYKY